LVVLRGRLSLALRSACVPLLILLPRAVLLGVAVAVAPALPASISRSFPAWSVPGPFFLLAAHAPSAASLTASHPFGSRVGTQRPNPPSVGGALLRLACLLLVTPRVRPAPLREPRAASRRSVVRSHLHAGWPSPAAPAAAGPSLIPCGLRAAGARLARVRAASAPLRRPPPAGDPTLIAFRPPTAEERP